MKTDRLLHVLGAGVLLLASAGVAWYGQPDPDTKWNYLAAELDPRLTMREVQIEPAELMGLMHDDYIDLKLIDVRDERDWNLFHLWGAEHIPFAELPAASKRFKDLGHTAVIVLIGNDEGLATQAWKRLMAMAHRPNAYILAGGMNRWLDEFSPHAAKERISDPAMPDETLRHPMKWALGSRHPAAMPDPHHVPQREFTTRVKLQKRVIKKGGCG